MQCKAQLVNPTESRGRRSTAMKYIDKALEIAPFSSINLNYKGFLHYMMEDYKLALPYFKRSLDVQAELPFPVVYIGACYLLLGQHKEGLAYFEDLPKDDSGFLAKLGGTTIAHAMMGSITKAEEGIAKLESFLKTPSAGNALNFLVLCHTQLGQLEKAMEMINKGIENHFPMVLLLPTEPLAQPLHNLPVFKQTIDSLFGETSLEQPTRKYKKTLFNSEEIEQHKSRLKSLMEKEELFLEPELTLRLIAGRMDLPPNHMSQLLNMGFDQNFSDFVNTYRLENFKHKLKSTKSHHLTILALAYDSGFNSKTVFNTFFKKKEGMTPKEYWNQIDF